jgi:hypothetical protein
MLYPFVGKGKAVKIFGSDLFENKDLLPLMLQLLGRAESKPMECVGTFDEMRAAFYLSQKVSADNNSYLLEYFIKNILPKYPKLESQSKKILLSWNNKNNLPKYANAILKKSI